jgi:hypothetical protein
MTGGMKHRRGAARAARGASGPHDGEREGE